MSKNNLSVALGTAKSREEVLKELRSMPDTYQLFQSFPSNVREEVLSFLTGQRGLDLLYDRFFKSVFDCQIHTDRVEKLISVLLGQPVKIREILPVEGSQLVEKGSFVIMDILVELMDGSIVDVEMQKIGYQFPVQRTACYLSDIMMRQYNRVRSARGEDFTYKDIKDVYLFILMEKSSTAFLNDPHPDCYLTRRQTFYDNGVSLPEIEHITYISLDIFRKAVQNVDTELMHMFSEALYILDRNTERLMVDEMRWKKILSKRLPNARTCPFRTWKRLRRNRAFSRLYKRTLLMRILLRA